MGKAMWTRVAVDITKTLKRAINLNVGVKGMIRDDDSDDFDVNELAYDAWLRASLFKQNVVTRLISNVTFDNVRENFIRR